MQKKESLNDEADFLQILNILEGIKAKRSHQGEKRAVNEYRTEFLAFMRQLWAYLPGSRIYDLNIHYSCTDANHREVAKLVAQYIHKWVFFSDKANSDFPVVPVELSNRFAPEVIPDDDSVYLNAYFPSERGNNKTTFSTYCFLPCPARYIRYHCYQPQKSEV